MSSLFIVQPGTKRYARMVQVKSWLVTLLNQGGSGATYRSIARGTGLSVPAVQRAVSDLHKDDPEVIAIPAYGNQWETSLGWTLEARIGEISQLRHNSTRVGNQAHRLIKIAAVTTDPYEKLALEATAREMEDAATRMGALADAMEASR